MKCDECRDDLTAYLDGEVSAARADEIRDHLNLCRPCATEHHEIKSAAQFVATHATPLPLRPDVWNGIYARISTLEVPDRSSNPLMRILSRWRAATAVVAVAAALAVGYWGYIRYETSEADLHKYMNAYLSEREEQERFRNTPVAENADRPSEAEAIHPEYFDNPFVEPEPIAYNNPFRSEDQ